MEAMKLTITGIKCDNPSCNYRDDLVPVEDYKKYVNKPCPECGSNLLTEVDYKNTMRLLKFAKLSIKLFRKKCLKEENRVEGTIEMDGTGKMDIKLK